MRPEISSRIEEIAQRVALSEGIEVVEVEVKGGGKNQFVRISIDKPEGVSHADCELISHQVGTILDVEDVVPGHYTLEVSSPGLERKLLKPRDYRAVPGQERPRSRCARRSKTSAIGRAPWRASRTASSAWKPPAGRSAFPLEQVEKANLKFEW